ncbi:MAG: sensor histidine kinase, partial [Nitrospiria bacterium]
ISTFPVYVSSGKVSFGIAMLTDVTEKKELEQALIQTEKMAAMGTLASGLAHEIGTPMNVILGRAETLLRHTQEKKTAKGLMIIIEQIDRMTHLIQHLLGFARRNPIDKRAADIDVLCDKAIEMMAHRITSNGIKLSLKHDQKLPAIWGDRDQILQVLVNLLMNAIDAIYQGGTITIQSKMVPETGKGHFPTSSRPTKKQMVQVLIKDTGRGIDSVHLDKIFDPFFTTKPVGKGTGLGLSVAQGIVREHGGQLEVSSVVGKGTTFCLLLPASSSDF